MSLSGRKQTQFELFPKPPSQSVPSVEKKSSWLADAWEIKRDHCVWLGIFVIVSMVVSYSLGMERGKRRRAVLREETERTRPPRAGYVSRRQTIRDRSPSREIRSAPAERGLSASSSEGVPIIITTSEDDNVGNARRKDPQPVERHNVSAHPEVVTASLATWPLPAISEKKVDNNYTIQVASFKTRAYAVKEADHLRRQGLEPLVLPKGEYVIVCVGRFSRKEEARPMWKKLRKRYKDCLIRRL